MKVMYTNIVLLFLTIWFTQVTVIAQDRALLIGVGDYVSDMIPDLPGIDKDLILMRNTLIELGVNESMIRILENQQGSVSSISNEILYWINDDLSPQDRVFIYYSGHGSQVQDESNDEPDDNKDELLVMHDADVVNEALTNCLIDDQLEELLASIPSQNVFVFIDACHSGSAHRRFNQNVSKFVDFGIPNLKASKGMAGSRGRFRPASSLPTTPSSSSSQSSNNNVTLSATQDDEEAQASNEGSYFTLGISKAVEEAKTSGKKISMKDLLTYTTKYIAENIGDPLSVYKPNLSGDQKLQSVNLIRTGNETTSLDNGVYSDYWKTMERSVEEANYAVPIVTNKKQFYPGELLEIYVDVPKDGYLYVFNLSQEDTEKDMLILYPNSYDRDNHVKKGTTVTVPPSESFTLPASPPYSASLIVVFILPRPLPISMDSNELIAGIFPQLKGGNFVSQLETQKPSRGKFAVVPGKPLEEKVIGAGKTTVEVIKK